MCKNKSLFKNNQAQDQRIAGIYADVDSSFIKLLKSDGFQDVKTMIKYKDDFRKLADLFELDSVA